MNTRDCKYVMLILFLATTAPSVMAANEVTALITLGPLDITLVDLDAQDGITPSFRWTQNAWTNEIERQAYFHVNGVASGIPGFSDPKRTQIAGDMITTVPGEASYAQILGDLQGLGVFLSMQPGPTSRLAFGNTEFNLEPSGRYHGEGEYFGTDYTFEISASTAVIISSTVSGTLENRAAGSGHSARVNAFLHAGILESEEPEGYSNPYGIPWYPNVHDGSGTTEIGRDSDGLYQGPSADWSFAVLPARLLSVRYDNASSALGYGYFHAGASAQINTAAVAVPEPAAAMLANILGILVLSWHRSKRHFS